eukprot:4522391-Amphidinium_carterae.1
MASCNESNQRNLGSLHVDAHNKDAFCGQRNRCKILRTNVSSAFGAIDEYVWSYVTNDEP